MQRPLREDIGPRDADRARVPAADLRARRRRRFRIPRRTCSSTACPTASSGARPTTSTRARSRDPSLVWDDPAHQRRYREIVAQVREWDAELPSRTGVDVVTEIVNRITPRFPRPPLWIAVGLVALLVRRPAEWRTIVVLWTARVPRAARPRGVPGRRTRVRVTALSDLHRHCAGGGGRGNEDDPRLASIDRVSRGSSRLDERSSDGTHRKADPLPPARSTPKPTQPRAASASSSPPHAGRGSTSASSGTTATCCGHSSGGTSSSATSRRSSGSLGRSSCRSSRRRVYVIIFGKFANFPTAVLAYPSLVVAGVLPDAVLRLGADALEHEPALEPAARDEGLLPAHAAPSRGAWSCR